jgi:hypothetical protein
MKKTILFFIAAFMCLEINAQSFYKGALVTELRTGIEVYNIYSSVSQNLGSRNRDTVYTDKAGNSYFGFGAEYGLHKMLGVGVSFNAHKFFSETDSASGKKPDTRANDFLVMLNFHPVTTKKFDLVLGSDIGYSGFKYKTFDKDNTILTGKGMYFSAYVNPRIYFGAFGINFKLSTPFMKYSNVTTNNADFNKNTTYNYLKLSAAWGLSFGVQYRFIKNKSAEKTTN